jgi:CBS domain-containing protein
VPAEETRAWIESFEFLQLMRLRAQLGGEEGEQALRQAGDSPNTIRPGRLSVLDRRILKEAFRQARKLQQRLELDYR